MVLLKEILAEYEEGYRRQVPSVSIQNERGCHNTNGECFSFNIRIESFTTPK